MELRCDACLRFDMREAGMEHRLWCPKSPERRHEYRADYWSCLWCDVEMSAPGVAADDNE